jgi:hypothetical protein
MEGLGPGDVEGNSVCLEAVIPDICQVSPGTLCVGNGEVFGRQVIDLVIHTQIVF